VWCSSNIWSIHGESLHRNSTFKGEGLKEELPNGNEEKGSEEGSEEEETLTNRAGRWPR